MYKQLPEEDCTQWQQMLTVFLESPDLLLKRVSNIRTTTPQTFLDLLQKMLPQLPSDLSEAYHSSPDKAMLTRQELQQKCAKFISFFHETNVLECQTITATYLAPIPEQLLDSVHRFIDGSLFFTICKIFQIPLGATKKENGCISHQFSLFPITTIRTKPMSSPLACLYTQKNVNKRVVSSNGKVSILAVEAEIKAYLQFQG